MKRDAFGFGEFLKERRKAKGFTISSFAEKLEVTPAYVSDIEKGRRYAPAAKLDEIAELLDLSQSDKETMFDLAASTRSDQVSSDISDYIMETDLARVALRRARDVNLSDNEWQRLIDYINDTGSGR